MVLYNNISPITSFQLDDVMRSVLSFEGTFDEMCQANQPHGRDFRDSKGVGERVEPQEQQPLSHFPMYATLLVLNE